MEETLKQVRKKLNKRIEEITDPLFDEKKDILKELRIAKKRTHAVTIYKNPQFLTDEFLEFFEKKGYKTEVNIVHSPFTGKSLLASIKFTW